MVEEQLDKVLKCLIDKELVSVQSLSSSTGIPIAGIFALITRLAEDNHVIYRDLVSNTKLNTVEITAVGKIFLAQGGHVGANKKEATKEKLLELQIEELTRKLSSMDKLINDQQAFWVTSTKRNEAQMVHFETQISLLRKQITQNNEQLLIIDKQLAIKIIMAIIAFFTAVMLVLGHLK